MTSLTGSVQQIFRLLAGGLGSLARVLKNIGLVLPLLVGANLASAQEIATGGTVTTDESGGFEYVIHTFTSDTADKTFTPSETITGVEILLVGGGAGVNSSLPKMSLTSWRSVLDSLIQAVIWARLTPWSSCA